jgi:hypothetical protein
MKGVKEPSAGLLDKNIVQSVIASFFSFPIRVQKSPSGSSDVPVG